MRRSPAAKSELVIFDHELSIQVTVLVGLRPLESHAINRTRFEPPPIAFGEPRFARSD
jgi:hypothetical protein